VTLKTAVVWNVKPCGSCNNRHFGETYRFHHQDDKNPRTRKMLAVTSSQTRCDIPEDGILHSHRRQTVKSYVPFVVFSQSLEAAVWTAIALFHNLSMSSLSPLPTHGCCTSYNPHAVAIPHQLCSFSVCSCFSLLANYSSPSIGYIHLRYHQWQWVKLFP
jgi:hypothetical protein